MAALSRYPSAPRTLAEASMPNAVGSAIACVSTPPSGPTVCSAGPGGPQPGSAGSECVGEVRRGRVRAGAELDLAPARVLGVSILAVDLARRVVRGVVADDGVTEPAFRGDGRLNVGIGQKIGTEAVMPAAARPERRTLSAPRHPGRSHNPCCRGRPGCAARRCWLVDLVPMSPWAMSSITSRLIVRVKGTGVARIVAERVGDVAGPRER